MPQGWVSLLMNMGYSFRSLFYSEETACGSDTLAVLLNSQRCVMKGMKIWHTVKAWVLLTGRHLYECVCVCALPCSSPPLYIKGKISRPMWAELWGPLAFDVTVETKSLDSHLKKTNAILIVIKQAPTWNQTFCPKIFLSGQSGLKYRAMMRPALTVDVQAISIKAPIDTNRLRTVNGNQMLSIHL